MKKDAFGRMETRLKWILRRDLRPRVAGQLLRYRVLELWSAILFACCGALMVPLTLALLLLEPVMILLRPIYLALFRSDAVEKLMATVSAMKPHPGEPVDRKD